MVVVAHASAGTLGDCLRALPIGRLHGVVVVDNGSPDDSAGVAAGVRGVTVVRQDNRGFGAGCNRGAAELPGAELLLFLNPDAVIEPADLLALVDHLDRHPGSALVGPRLYRDGEPLTSAGHRAGVRSELRLVVPARVSRWLPDRRLPADHDVTGPVGYVEGACFLVRAGALYAAGGFDEAFFLFCEELDLARRLEQAGLTCDLLATARAQHLVAVSRATLPDKGRAHLLRSTALHLRREAAWKGWAYGALARLSLAVRTGVDRDVARAWSAAIRDGLRAAR